MIFKRSSKRKSCDDSDETPKTSFEVFGCSKNNFWVSENYFKFQQNLSAYQEPPSWDSIQSSNDEWMKNQRLEVIISNSSCKTLFVSSVTKPIYTIRQELWVYIGKFEYYWLRNLSLINLLSLLGKIKIKY